MGASDDVLIPPTMPVPLTQATMPRYRRPRRCPLAPATTVSAPRPLVEHSPGASVHFFAKDRKSTRLNSSHVAISYAVFCLKKKNNTKYRNSSHHRKATARCLHIL